MLQHAASQHQHSAEALEANASHLPNTLTLTIQPSKALLGVELLGRTWRKRHAAVRSQPRNQLAMAPSNRPGMALCVRVFATLQTRTVRASGNAGVRFPAPTQRVTVGQARQRSLVARRLTKVGFCAVERCCERYCETGARAQLTIACEAANLTVQRRHCLNEMRLLHCMDSIRLWRATGLNNECRDLTNGQSPDW